MGKGCQDLWCYFCWFAQLPNFVSCRFAHRWQTQQVIETTYISESWYLDKSEDESEEGLDDNMMAYVHQAEEILKEGANLLQKHQTMKTEVPYGDMFSSFEYAKSSDFVCFHVHMHGCSGT
jgi:hypothetical protein